MKLLCLFNAMWMSVLVAPIAIVVADVIVTAPSKGAWPIQGSNFDINWKFAQEDTAKYNITHIFVQNDGAMPPVNREIGSGPFSVFSSFLWKVPEDWDGVGWTVVLRNSSDPGAAPFAVSDKFAIVKMVNSTIVPPETSPGSSSSSSSSSSSASASSEIFIPSDEESSASINTFSCFYPPLFFVALASNLCL